MKYVVLLGTITLLFHRSHSCLRYLSGVDSEKDAPQASRAKLQLRQQWLKK
jgi:hypothetical protein